MTKVQLTLTAQEADILSAKAAQLGYNLTRFIKFMISQIAVKTVEKDNIPTFQISKKAEKIAFQARKDYENGKTTEIRSFKGLEKVL